MKQTIIKTLEMIFGISLLIIGLIFLIIGIIGIFLPLIPGILLIIIGVILLGLSKRKKKKIIWIKKKIKI